MQNGKEGRAIDFSRLWNVPPAVLQYPRMTNGITRVINTDILPGAKRCVLSDMHYKAHMAWGGGTQMVIAIPDAELVVVVTARARAGGFDTMDLVEEDITEFFPDVFIINQFHKVRSLNVPFVTLFSWAEWVDKA